MVKKVCVLKRKGMLPHNLFLISGFWVHSVLILSSRVLHGLHIDCKCLLVHTQIIPCHVMAGIVSPLIFVSLYKRKSLLSLEQNYASNSKRLWSAIGSGNGPKTQSGSICFKGIVFLLWSDICESNPASSIY